MLSCIAKTCLVIGALRQFLGCKDLQQSTFCWLPKSDDSGNWRRWEFRRNISLSGWEPTEELWSAAPGTMQGLLHAPIASYVPQTRVQR